MNARQFRERARFSLRGNWGTAVLVSLVASLLCGGLFFRSQYPVVWLCSMFPEIGSSIRELFDALRSFSDLFGAAAFVLSGPIMLGLHRYYLALHDGKPVQFRDLFSGFSRFGDAFLLKILVTLFEFLWSLPMMIPIVIGYFMTFLGGANRSIPIIGLVLVLAGAALSPLVVIANIRYSMAFYIMLERKNLTANQCLNVSVNMMQGNKARYFRLCFSFIGWYLLGGLTFGIGYLFLVPYMQAACTAFYRELVPAAKPLPEAPMYEPLAEAVEPEQPVNDLPNEPI